MKNLIIIFLSAVLFFRIYPCDESSKTKRITEKPANTESSFDVRKCMDAVDLSAFKNVQRTSCYIKEVDRLEAVLDVTLHALRNSNPDETKIKLLDSQEAWRSARDSWCGYVAELPLAPHPLFNEQFCLASETHKRIDELDKMKREVLKIQGESED